MWGMSEEEKATKAYNFRMISLLLEEFKINN